MSTSFEDPPLSSAPAMSLEPSDDSYLGIVDTTTAPSPTAKRITWAVFKSFFLHKPRTVPASPIYTGTLMDMCTDGRHLYVRGPIAWGRVPLQSSMWNVADVSWTPKLRGQVALTEGQSTVVIEYPVAFETEPIPDWIAQNTTPGDRSVLSGIITASTTTGFTVTLSTPPDSGEYVINWSAEGASTGGSNTDPAVGTIEVVHAVDASAGPSTVTLEAPSAYAIKKAYVKKTDASFNTITIDVTGGCTIDGASSVVVGLPGQGLLLVADGTEWHIIAQF